MVVVVDVEAKGALPGLLVNLDTWCGVLADAEGRRLTAWTVELKSSFFVCRPLDVFTRLNAYRPSFLM